MPVIIDSLCAMGYEYKDFPNSHQKNTIVFLTDLGVDVVIGSHPHVIHPFWCTAQLLYFVLRV